MRRCERCGEAKPDSGFKRRCSAPGATLSRYCSACLHTHPVFRPVRHGDPQPNSRPLNPALIYLCRGCGATPATSRFPPSKPTACTPCYQAAMRISEGRPGVSPLQPKPTPCRWCGTMIVRTPGPWGRHRHTKVFCGPHCRNEFQTLARVYALGLVEAGKLTIAAMHETVDRHRSSNMTGRNKKDLIR